MELDRSARPRGPHTTREGRFVDEPPDPDHPCSTAALGLVPDPPGWTRRAKATRCPGPGKAPDRIPADVGIVDVRPNVRRDTRERGCRTLFRSWSIKSHEDACVVAEVQDVWILGARFHINERELARARRGREKNVNSWVYGFAVPAGSITPDPTSAVVIGYDPWSIVHPGFFELAPGEYRSRLGRDVRDDRFNAGEQYAAAHLWIDPATRSPRIVVYRRLLSVDSTLLPNPIRGLIMRPRKRRTSRRNPGACGCAPNPLLTPRQLGEMHGRQSVLHTLTGKGKAVAFERYTREADQRDYDLSRALAASRATREFTEARELPGRGTSPAPRGAKEDRRKVLPEVEQQPHAAGAGFSSRRGGAFEMYATSQSAQTARDKLLAKGSPYGYAEIRQVASPGRGRTYGAVLEVPPNPGHPAWEAAGIGAGGRVAGPSGWAGAYDLAEQEYYLRPILGRPQALPLPAPPAPPAPPPAPRYRAPGQLSLLPERQLKLFNPSPGVVIDDGLYVSASSGRGKIQPLTPRSRFQIWQVFSTPEAARQASRGGKIVGLFWNGPRPQGFAIDNGAKIVGVNGSIPRVNAIEAGWTIRAVNPSRARAARAAVVRLNASESAALARGDRAFARRVLSAARGLALRHDSPVRVEDSAGVALLRVRAPR